MTNTGDETPTFSSPDSEPVDQQLLNRIDRLARLLDSEFVLFGFRFGLDGLIGLIPGIGDATTAGVSFYLIYQALKFGAPASLIARMIINILIDTILGAIPLFGDIFDFAFRANAMNARLLHQYLEKRAATE